MIDFLERTFTAGVVAAALYLGVFTVVGLVAPQAHASAPIGTSTAEPLSAKGEPVARGDLAGRSGKRVSGDAILERTADGGYLVRLTGDFSLSRVPDPTIGFAKGGSYVETSEFTELASFRGEQVYRVPAGVDPAEFDGLFIWCREFSVPLAFAALR